MSPPPIPEVLVLCGHGNYGPDADDHVRRVAAAAREAGQYPEYLIYGNDTNARGRRKHNFLIGRAPAVAYTFVNLLYSDAERACFVGNQDTRQIFEACMQYFQPTNDFFFIEEGRSGLAENVMAGRRALYGDRETDRHTLLLNGDLPLLFHLNAPLKDPDMQSYDMIFDANSRELQGGLLPREYHLRLEAPDPTTGASRMFWVKESNYFLLKLKFLTAEMMDSVYRSRRIHDAESGSWRDLFSQIYFRGLRIFRTLAILLRRHAWHNILSRLSHARDNWIFDCRQAEQLIEYGLRVLGYQARCRVKVTNRDPGAKKDLDSFGDWSYLNAMYALSGRDFHLVYPHAEAIHGFARDMMPRLKRRVEIFRNYPAYMNREFRNFGLLEPYDRRGNFQPRLVAEQTVFEDILFHREFVQSLKLPGKRAGGPRRPRA
ncbi:MAG: hypothetical protein H7A21_07475 [Spirochaetales bacterium]|nr:hypothetical protein [Spirochaetales bacterium]MCP5485689.1 hypothetical protein [Spirochaetales bacterium]